MLKYLAEGLVGKQITDKMGIGEQTVKNYVREIFLRLGVKTRAEAVYLGCQRGYLNVGGDQCQL